MDENPGTNTSLFGGRVDLLQNCVSERNATTHLFLLGPLNDDLDT